MTMFSDKIKHTGKLIKCIEAIEAISGTLALLREHF